VAARRTIGEICKSDYFQLIALGLMRSTPNDTQCFETEVSFFFHFRSKLACSREHRGRENKNFVPPKGQAVAAECAASASRPVEPESKPPINFATAMATLERSAMTTVRVLSPSATLRRAVADRRWGIARNILDRSSFLDGSY
jgi:hypothetical protein